MPNYDIPKPTPAEALKKRFDDISAQDLTPVMVISQSLDAVADAIRLYVEEPDTLRDLAQQVSISAHDIAVRAGVEAPPPAPKSRRSKAAAEDETAD